jgi:hypothetical protein
MRLRWCRRAIWAPTLIAALAVSGTSRTACLGQVASPERVAARLAWTPLSRALNATIRTGTPTLVVVTSRTEPGSLQFCRALTYSREVGGLTGSLQFAEMASELYKDQVKTLGVRTFPTLIVYRRGGRGLEMVSFTSGLTEPHQVVDWLGSVGLVARETAPADAAILRAGQGGAMASDQAYPSAQNPQPSPPSKQPMGPPPPPYVPPPYAPPPVQMAPPPQQYFAPYPAPAPVYVQPPTPTMIVQQAPQQIILAPAPPPQVTIAMAPSAAPTVSYAPVGGAPPAGNAPPNLFTQPGAAPPGAAPPVAMAPPMQPVYAQAPPTANAPPVGQGPIAATALAMTLTNPSLINRLVGALGEHLAQKKNPRVQMAQAPAMAPAPTGGAPVAYAPIAQTPIGYAPVTVYPPTGQPGAYMTPESTFFAPCNTYRAPCRYHGGPCPGPGPQYAPPSPYPAGSPQAGPGPGYAPGPQAPYPQAPRRPFFSWFHSGQ